MKNTIANLRCVDSNEGLGSQGSLQPGYNATDLGSKLNILRSSILLILVAMFSSQCLAESPRIPFGNHTEEQSKLIRERYIELKKSATECIEDFIDSYQKSLFEYCELTGEGRSVGGGCTHSAYTWSLHIAVLEDAIEKCE